MIDPVLVLNLSDKDITEILVYVEAIMCISAYPDYGPAESEEDRRDQVKEILATLSRYSDT